MIEDSYIAAEIADLPRSDWDAADGRKRIECRHHQRFRLDKDTFALIRTLPAGPLRIHGKSMGGIACAVFNAKPTRLGKIDNISMGGLMFYHVDSKVKLNQAVVLDILLADIGFYLANIPFKTITDIVIPSEVSSDSIELRQVRLQFQKLNLNQQASLNNFILSYGTEIRKW